MRNRRILYKVFLMLGSIAASLSAQQVQAVRTDAPVSVDGVLDEQAWQHPGWTAFKMKRPFEGAPPSQKTEVWVAYDENAVYVAARMYDTAPDSIMTVLGRRDYDVTADWFSFLIDPYRDKRTGYYFTVSAAGSIQDGTLFNDDWNDNSWDGVWEAKTRIDDKGWAAEMRIPFSQLRFTEKEQHVWGVNFRRSIGRNSERDLVVYTPNQESGFVSRFPELVGIEHIAPSRQAEVLPYLTSKAEYLKHDAGDPFKTGSRYLPGLGGDMRIALSSNLMLNATINPDFGQVEVDPAVVNLSDIESYFQEKRPFFVEGTSTFNFGNGGASSNWGFNFGTPDFFYSRRIGRAPQGSLPFSAQFVDYPLGTHILGAGKITGKVIEGWNFGMIHALTNREYAQAETSGTRVHDIEVEPLTYYGIARLQKDFNDGKQGFGLIATSTDRMFNDERLRDQINASAQTGGIDGWSFFDDGKTYVMTGWLGYSHVAGSAARMTSLQRSSRHYFQRPDASYLSVDSNATSMTGFAGRVAVNKQKGPVIFNAAFGIINPKFDVNDLGFYWRTDIINYHVVVGYKWTDPTPYYNSVRLQTALFESRDFGNRIGWRGWWINAFAEFTNFWTAGAGFVYNPPSVDTRSTRGGPAMFTPVGREFFFNVASDSRKPAMVELYSDFYIGAGGEQTNVNVSVTYKPAPNINFSVGPGFSKGLQEAMWITSYDDAASLQTYGRRYVFAHLSQQTLSANIRLNWTFTPQLSLQLFMQPLISSGKYTNLKHFLRPGTFEFGAFGSDGSTLNVNRDNGGNVSGYTIDADGGGPSPEQSISNPDFNFKSLRGNAVLRWEYRPGSTVYFVWTQLRSDWENVGEFQFNHSVDRLMEAKPDNVFMVKLTYWFNL
ncbi:MAG: carbohydrate binding family 9 domain-containing protein [Ignavibacteriales bacterium]|nr:carbohydrate binding family 9 domain-containing protein [Ignavibacteriales bacterium]